MLALGGLRHSEAQWAAHCRTFVEIASASLQGSSGSERVSLPSSGCNASARVGLPNSFGDA